MTIPHDNALSARNELRDKIAENLADSLDDGLNWMEYREQANTCLEAIAWAGGIVCAWELSELRNRLAKLPKSDRGISWQLYNWQHSEELTVYGSTANCLKWILDNTEVLIAALSHIPIEAVNGGDGWLPIDRADKSVDRIYDFPGMPRPIGNSEEYWVRDRDGRIYQAVWADDGVRSYWWDLEGESPVDPVDFMPHPLDRRFASTPSNEGSEKP